ncbi:MAG: hypothetical protein BJ554DRAFT_640, partial [Olpidium bornovanus]
CRHCRVRGCRRLFAHLTLDAFHDCHKVLLPALDEGSGGDHVGLSVSHGSRNTKKRRRVVRSVVCSIWMGGRIGRRASVRRVGLRVVRFVAWLRCSVWMGGQFCRRASVRRVLVPASSSTSPSFQRTIVMWRATEKDRRMGGSRRVLFLSTKTIVQFGARGKMRDNRWVGEMPVVCSVHQSSVPVGVLFISRRCRWGVLFYRGRRQRR